VLGNLTDGAETNTALQSEIYVTDTGRYEMTESGTLTTEVDGTDEGTSENETMTADGSL